MKIALEIESCRECPHLNENRVYTGDSFENVFEWFCKKKTGKKIAGYVETFDKVEIPKWCPIIIKK